MLERIEKDGELLALVVRNNYSADGTNFISEASNAFQIGFHNRKKGYRYKKHITLPFSNISFNPNKIYYVQEGKLLIGIEDRKIELGKVDLICFISGSHDVEMLEDGKFIEIKQGPYRGEKDKRFIE